MVNVSELTFKLRHPQKCQIRLKGIHQKGKWVELTITGFASYVNYNPTAEESTPKGNR